MSSSYDKHQSQVEQARKSNGEFGSYESGESGVTLLTHYDTGEQAYGELTSDEQAAWHAWREMTGKSEETVAGQAKADDIAEFKQHYLGTFDEDAGPPLKQVAESVGIQTSDRSIVDVENDVQERISSGMVETYTDEETGDTHCFAHPHLAQALAAGGGYSSSLPPTAVDTGDDDDFDPEEGWEGIEPDFDDYTFRSQDGVMRAGLSNLHYGEIYWDNEQAFSSASEEGRSGALSFDARGGFDEVEIDYLPEDLAERVQHHGDRNLSIASHSPSYSRTQCGEDNQFVSVELNEAEHNAVVDYLDGENPDEFNDDLVHYWSAGEPAQMDRTFGLTNPKKAWDDVSEAVRERAPNAAHGLETAEDLRREANKSFEAEVAHMHSDAWKKEEARLRNEF